ncbi:MAG: DUF6263 family protein [Planctomycetota bacterium]
MSHMKSKQGQNRAWQALVGAVALGIGGVALAEPVEIKPNFQIGSEYQQRMTMEQDIEQTVMGNPMNIAMDMMFDMTTTVAEHPDDGVFRLQIVYDRVEAEVDGPMGPGRWASGDPQPMNPMLMGFAAMDGMTLSYDYSVDGDVTNLEGTEAILDKSLAGVPQAMRAQMREMFEGQFGKEQMTEMIKAGHGIYPDRPVSVGDAWNQSLEIGGMMPMLADSTYELKDVSGNQATVDVNGILETTDDAAMAVGPGMEAEMQMQGTQDGQLTYNLDTGWIEAIQLQQTIDGELTMANPGNPEGPPMVIPMKVSSTIQVELID